MPITQANLVTKFTPLLDEVFASASVTEALTGDPAMARAGTNARKIRIPKISVQGLADYSRSGGYVDGDVSVEWEEKEFNYDRGRRFIVDAMDDEETFNIAFGRLAAEFVRTKVAPEADAFTFASLAGTPGILTATPGTYASGTDVLTALREAVSQMYEAHVPQDGLHLYITKALKGAVEDLDTIKSKEVLSSFAAVTVVPQDTFYTAITLLTGGAGEEAGAYAKAPAGKNINFMVVYKPALIKFDKHVINGLITPAENQTHDAYGVKYRKYGIVEVYDNKTAGIYLSNKA